MASVDSFITFPALFSSFINAGRGHCWGFTPVYTCQKDIILSWSAKSFVHLWHCAAVMYISTRKLQPQALAGMLHKTLFFLFCWFRLSVTVNLILKVIIYIIVNPSTECWLFCVVGFRLKVSMNINSSKSQGSSVQLWWGSWYRDNPHSSLFVIT